jgi:hypothetical protein
LALLLGLAGCMTLPPWSVPPARPPLRHFVSHGPPSHLRVVLSFDDGPSNERDRSLGLDAAGLPDTPTERVLDVLAAEHISAAFFVLTGPERRILGVHPHAETPLGFELLEREAREGHLLACHWGGAYQSQHRLHLASLVEPAYDADGDGRIDRVTFPGNALESELLQCMERIAQAYRAAGRPGERAEFVRPPLWIYRRGPLDARPTYRALGLHMILTDARIHDGGLGFFPRVRTHWMTSELRQAVLLGQRDLVLELHDDRPWTASSLELTLALFRQDLARMGLREGTDWDFTRTTAEVREVLRAKRW